jgi:hypothetical protein
MSASPEVPSTRVSIAKPTAASARPPAITNAGRTRRTASGASIEPAMSPPEEGTVHRPATRGESPSTSCRYCAMKRNIPAITKMLSANAASEVLKAGTRKSPRSINGSANSRCLRTKAAPTASPAAMESTASHPTPSWAICLSP